MMNIVITGGSKGMGKALANRFAAANNNIFICSRNENALRATAREINGEYPTGNVQYFAADLSTRSGIDDFSSWIMGREKNIDILINNAGTFIPGSIYNEKEGILEEMMAVNLFSAYHLTRSLLPEMIKNKKGHIFNMCSIASFQAYSNGGSYSISKFALLGFSRNLREEMKQYGIKVTAVMPGAVYTPSWEGAGIPTERFMQPEDIAELIFSAATLSPQACVEDLIIRPLQGDIT